MGITLRNDKRRLPSFSIEIEDLLDNRPLDKKCYFLKVPAGRQQSTSYRHTFPRRGRYQLSGLRVATKFPFAFFRKSRVIDAPGDVIVFPALREAGTPPVLGRDARASEQRPRAARRGEFFGLRDYRAGDDPRDVNWKKSAQRGHPVVREHEEESAHQVTLRLDNAVPHGASAEALEGLESAISTAASLCVHYVTRGYTVRLETRGQAVPGGVGEHHMLRLLRCLALLESAAPDTPFTLPASAATLGRSTADEVVMVDANGARALTQSAGAA
jgi:uncharacterized protein (DUF58 family)